MTIVLDYKGHGTRFRESRSFQPWKDRPTLVSRMSDPHENQITESVKQFSDPAIWTKPGELHTSLKDLSKFWAFHKERVKYKA